jgi:HD-GYP domain-containing protein (c-di-GMP phosphodiesterase class II)/transcriptional regulator with GAF, ATPase, and Fis domain
MCTDPEPFDKISDPTTYLIESPKATALMAQHVEEQLPLPVQADHDHPGFAADLNKQVQILSRQLEEERQQLANQRMLNERLLSLKDFGQELENTPDPELTAQNMAKTLVNLLGCGLVCIFIYHIDDQRYKLLTCAGPAAPLVPTGYSPDLNFPVIEQALRQKLIVTNIDFLEAGEPLVLGDQPFPSVLAAPLNRRGTPRGLMLLADPCKQAFGAVEVPVVEAAAAHLLNAWDYSIQNEALTDFVQTVTMMSVVQETGSLLERIASIARRTLTASYTLVAIRNQQEWLMRGSGRAPQIFRSLQNGAASFLEEAVKSPYTFRMNDLRRDARSAVIPLDSSNLCSLLASPIRINGVTTGLLLAFGKNLATAFTDLDVFMAERLSEQAAVNLESCYLNQELRANLKTTQLLYDLSMNIAKAESLTDAASAIGRAAYHLMQAQKCGLILFSTDGQVEAEVRFPSDDPTISHPYRLIQQAVDSRQTIYLAETDNILKSATPIQTMRRCYGALWMEFIEETEENRHPTEEIRILVNQAAVALERSILLEETRKQANDIARAYEDLLYGLTRALDARDRDTEWHSKRVEDMSVRLGIEMGLTGSELQVLKRGALLHDIGKIGVPDGILHKPGPLDDDEWQEMRQHPQKGAEIIQEIPALRDALPVVAFHQERWDGSGYPLHLRGTDIPLLARIFAVVDVYDALTSDRPYRTALTAEEALEYLAEQAGIHFDPDVVAQFAEMIHAGLGPANTGLLSTGSLDTADLQLGAQKPREKDDPITPGL